MLLIVISTAFNSLRELKKSLSWRDLLQNIHSVGATTKALDTLNCVKEDCCLTVIFIGVILQVQMGVSNILLCLTPCFRVN